MIAYYLFSRIVARTSLVHSEIVRQLEQAYRSGEMDDLKASILPFIRKNRDKLREFIRDFQRVEGPCSLDQMIKFFILQHNMPFNMANYMAKQSDTIKQEIETQARDKARQECIAEWIRQKAEAHRSTSMFEQVFCFEKMKDAILPVIEEELGLHPAS
jgi:hypothetical protein